MIVDLLLRLTHIIAAIVLVGGTFFLRFALTPALVGQTRETQDSLLAAWRPRWARLVMLASGLLLVSGLANAVRIILHNDLADAPYHAFVAVKLLLAMVIFWISAALSGRSAMAERFREKMSLWLNVNIILTVAIVCLGGYMKLVPRTPKPAESADRPEAIQSDSLGARLVPNASRHES